MYIISPSFSVCRLPPAASQLPKNQSLPKSKMLPLGNVSTSSLKLLWVVSVASFSPPTSPSTPHYHLTSTSIGIGVAGGGDGCDQDGSGGFSSCSFYPIELISTNHTSYVCTVSIDGGDDISRVVLKNVQPSSWQATKSGYGLVLSYSPSDIADESWKDLSHIDIRLGDWADYHTIDSKSNDETETRIRWMACARQTRYWTGPAFGGCTSNSSKHTSNSENFIPLDTQFLLVEWGEKKKKDSTIEPQMYALVLPLVDGSFRTSLQSERDAVGSKAKDSDTLVCHIDSFDDTVHFSSLATDPLQLRSVYILVGSNPYDMLKQGFRDVADELQTFNTLDRKQVSGMVNQFGWCSWDAFCEYIAILSSVC